MKRLLLVNTLPEGDPAAQTVIKELQMQEADAEIEIVQAYKRNFHPCIGCNACWLKTPGRCAIPDGYEDLLRAYLAADAVLFLCGTALNFVDHRMKNLIDRLLPLVTMNIHFVEGECRHIPRYDKCYRFGLLYGGQADRAYLNHWMERVMLNFAGKSIGAYPITEVQEVISCIW